MVIYAEKDIWEKETKEGAREWIDCLRGKETSYKEIRKHVNTLFSFTRKNITLLFHNCFQTHVRQTCFLPLFKSWMRFSWLKIYGKNAVPVYVIETKLKNDFALYRFAKNHTSKTLSTTYVGWGRTFYISKYYFAVKTSFSLLLHCEHYEHAQNPFNLDILNISVLFLPH